MVENGRGRRHVINVCFHGIGQPRRELEPGEARMWVTRDQFLATLDEVVGRSDAALSFDDGNASDVDVAVPALVERGLTATFFLVAGRLGQPGSVDHDGVRALVDAGMTVGTHGMDHRSWRGLDDGARRRELDDARAELAGVAGVAVRDAACPLGQYDRTVLKALRRRGYGTVYTSDRRLARRGAWLQPRFSVRGNDPAGRLFESMLVPPTRDRWVAAARGTVKRWR